MLACSVLREDSEGTRVDTVLGSNSITADLTPRKRNQTNATTHYGRGVASNGIYANLEKRCEHLKRFAQKLGPGLLGRSRLPAGER